MESLLLVAVLGALGYGAYRLATKDVASSHTVPNRTPRPVNRVRTQRRRLVDLARQRRERRERINNLGRSLQLALIRLEEAPDFRRAASFAAVAKDVPAAFRQRQFRRFRPRIVRHFATCLQAGGDQDVLLQSLVTLLKHLGIAAYEAEYIRDAATRSRTPVAVPAAPSFEQRLHALQQHHEQRITALRAIPDLNPDAREQLLEAEDTRFRQALDALGSDDPLQPRR